MLDHVENGTAETRQDASFAAGNELPNRRRDWRGALDRAAAVLLAWRESGASDLDLIEAAVALGLTAERARVAVDTFAQAVFDLCAASEDSCLTVRRRPGDKMLTRVALKCFALAQAHAVRHRMRALRHDLRNPLGTARNSLVLLGEEAQRLPEPPAALERLRAMAARNVRAAEELIRTRLTSDAADVPWTTARVADAAGVEDLLAGIGQGSAPARIRPEGSSPAQAVDRVALELALRVAIAAAETDDGAAPEIRVTAGAGDVLFAVSPVRAGARRDRALALEREIVARAGGHVREGAAAGSIVFSLPASPGDQRDDLARGGE